MDTSHHIGEKSSLLDGAGARSSAPEATGEPGQYGSGSYKCSNSTSSGHRHLHVGVYKRRWWILSVFCLTSLFQQVMWNTWTPLTDSVLIAYNWSSSFVGLLATLSNGFYTLAAFPLMYLVETKGLRFGMVIAAFLMVFGCAMWNIALSTSQSWIVVVVQLFIGSAGCITLASPPLISVLWFPISERTTATALASSYIGNGLAFITGPFISGAHVTADDVKHRANLTADYVSNLKTGLQDVIYFETAATLCCFILVLVYFPAKPPKPPSRSQTMAREDFTTGLKHLFKNPQFWILSIAYNVPTGSYNSWLQLISVNFRSLGIGEQTAGWIGFVSILASSFGSIGLSLIVDRFKRKTKLFLICVNICAIVIFGILVCIQEGYIPVSKQWITATLYILCIAVSLCMNGVIPLYYELGCEIAYPVYEGLTCSFITAMNTFAAMSYFVVMLIPSLSENPRWMTWTCFGVCIFSLPLLLILKEQFHRLNIETADRDDGDEGAAAIGT